MQIEEFNRIKSYGSMDFGSDSLDSYENATEEYPSSEDVVLDIKQRLGITDEK